MPIPIILIQLVKVWHFLLNFDLNTVFHLESSQFGLEFCSVGIREWCKVEYVSGVRGLGAERERGRETETYMYSMPPLIFHIWIGPLCMKSSQIHNMQIYILIGKRKPYVPLKYKENY